MKKLKPGKYRHYKGGIANVIGVAKHTEHHEEEFAIYDHPDENGNIQLWARPLEMFLEEVEVNGVMKPRFEYVGE